MALDGRMEEMFGEEQQPVKGYDVVLEGYRDWLNEWLFEKKAESDVIVPLGDGRWAIFSMDDLGDTFIVEVNRGRVVRS